METVHTSVDRAALTGTVPILDSVTEYIRFRPTDDGGWRAYAMNQASTMGVEAQIPPEAFEGPAPQVEFTISTDDLKRACRLIKSDMVDMDIGPRVVFSGNGTSIAVPTEAPKDDRSRSPGDISAKMDYPAEVMMDPAPVLEILKAVDGKEMDAVVFRVSDAGLGVSMGSDLREMDMTVPADSLTAVFGDARSEYPRDCMERVMMLVPKGTQCSVRMGTDTPVEVSFRSGNLTGLFLVAPRIRARDE